MERQKIGGIMISGLNELPEEVLERVVSHVEKLNITDEKTLEQNGSVLMIVSIDHRKPFKSFNPNGRISKVSAGQREEIRSNYARAPEDPGRKPVSYFTKTYGISKETYYRIAKEKNEEGSQP